ncbi:MAG: ferrous iron transport protein B, partial [Acetivibrio sp.]
DIVEERGMEIDLHRLPEMLGIPCIPVSARKKTGLDILMHTVAHHKTKMLDSNLEHHHYCLDKKRSGRHMHQHHRDYAVVYEDEIEDKIDNISERLLKKYPNIVNVRWHSIKMLVMDPEIIEKYPIELKDIVTHSYETEIINQKYDFIEEVIEEVLVNKATKEES